MPKHEPKIQVLFVLHNWLILPCILIIGFIVNIYPILNISSLDNVPIKYCFLIIQLVKNLPVVQETLVQFLGPEYLLEKGQATHSTVFLGFPCGSAGKESACNVGDLGAIPGLGRSPGEEKDYPLQYSGLENSMD